MERNGKQFSDPTFPPNENSLLKGLQLSNQNLANSSFKKWSKIRWLRVPEFYKNPTVFNKENEISPNEIKQGALVNCYFLSVIAALAEHPDRIKKIFITDEINTTGIYGIRLCLDGEWKEIVIDDYFPCDHKKSVPCFSTSSGHTLWVQIVEKCYAKAYGSYNKIEGGFPEHAMRDFTGANSIMIDNSNENLLIYLKEACAKKWIITASAGETEASKELLKEVGLIPMHSYTILEVHELPFEGEQFNNSSSNISINNVNNNIENLLKIRNPWSKNEWIGDWSDCSKLWREDLKIKLNYSNINGIFYMNFKDFKHYFSRIQISKIHDEYIYNSIKIYQKLNSYSLISMKISETSHLYISLVQQDKKNFNSFTNNKYLISRFIICKINDLEDQMNSLEYIGGKMGQDREIFEDRELESGEYLIFVEIDNNLNTNNFFNIKDFPFVISTYSKINVELKTIPNEEYPEVLQRIYKSCAKKHNNVVRFTNDGAPNCLK